jgi:hypothetical protein
MGAEVERTDPVCKVCNCVTPQSDPDKSASRREIEAQRIAHRYRKAAIQDETCLAFRGAMPRHSFIGCVENQAMPILSQNIEASGTTGNGPVSSKSIPSILDIFDPPDECAFGLHLVDTSMEEAGGWEIFHFSGTKGGEMRVVSVRLRSRSSIFPACEGVKVCRYRRACGLR